MGRGSGCGASGVLAAVLVVLAVVLGARGGKIYYPTNLHEIAPDITAKKCLQDSTCVLPPHLATGNRCKGGEEIKKAINDMKKKLSPRAGGGGGGGRGGMCNGMAGEVVWPATGECVTLLTRGPCPPGQWLKLNRVTYEPVCRHEPCEVPQVRGGGPGVMIEGECYPPSRLPPSPRCPSNQEWIVNEHGELECDCPPGLVYYPRNNACYKPYSQGPCAPGWIIKVEDAAGGGAGEAKCFRNACPEERMVRMDGATCRLAGDTDAANSDCYHIDTAGPCEGGSLITVDELFAEPICLTTHTIFGPVVNGCARGTMRDRMGRCRSTADSILSSIPLFTATGNAGSRRGVNGGLCPQGEFFAGGMCIRIVP